MVGRTLDESEGLTVRRLTAHPDNDDQFGNSLVSVLIQPTGHFAKGHMTQQPPFYWQLYWLWRFFSKLYSSMFFLSQPQLDGP